MHGSYFITADFAPLGFAGDDMAFCRHVTEAAGVTAIPVSAFYDGPDAPTLYARFAFCKQDAVLDKAVARRRRHFCRNTQGNTERNTDGDTQWNTLTAAG